MEKLLNTYIKEILDQYPEVAKVLEKHEIGCVTCNVGTCLLKDIIEIHNLSESDEQSLLGGIARIVFPDQDVEIPKMQRKPHVEGLKYSPPVKALVEEHVYIKRLIAHIPHVEDELTSNPENGRNLIRKSIDFIRNYADKFHHAKEEDILFKYFDENLDILKVMHQDHEQGRAHVRAIAQGLDTGDDAAVTEHLTAYGLLLTDHIKREDEILYPWLDRNLTTTQVGEMFSRFQEVEKKFGDAPANYEQFVADLDESHPAESISQEQDRGTHGQKPVPQQ